jgi:hypothetical protein
MLGVPLDMSRIHRECGNPSDQSVVADLILRQEDHELSQRRFALAIVLHASRNADFQRASARQFLCLSR